MRDIIKALISALLIVQSESRRKALHTYLDVLRYYVSHNNEYSKLELKLILYREILKYITTLTPQDFYDNFY